MPNCDWYATIDDHLGLLRWLFEERTCDVYELSSDHGKPLKHFASAEDVL
jgi:hypothetical protein